jgi:hypothetical protein
MATMPRTLTTISANSAKHNGTLIQSDRLRVPELKAVKGDERQPNSWMARDNKRAFLHGSCDDAGGN